MSINTTPYTRRAFTVDAVQVTEANMEAVAEWVGSEVTTQPDGNDYIVVNVIQPAKPHQTRALVGSWVLKSYRGFKVFTPTAFERTFEPVTV